MNLESRIIQILHDQALLDDSADEEQLISQYGADNQPESIYLLADKFGLLQLYDLLVAMLLDDTKSQYWGTVLTVIFYAMQDHRDEIQHCQLSADFVIALLYYRFPHGIDDGDQIWAIVCALKKNEDFYYEPMKDKEVLHEFEKIKQKFL
jgi:hypothetical protein